MSTNIVPLSGRPAPARLSSTVSVHHSATKQRVPNGNPQAARKALDAKRAEWAKLELRQSWRDEAFIRGHLKIAGLRIADDNEPATVIRMRRLLRKAGVRSSELPHYIGNDLHTFLHRNPRLPLWAATAFVLEATGRFTPAGVGYFGKEGFVPPSTRPESMRGEM